MLSRDCLWDWL